MVKSVTANAQMNARALVSLAAKYVRELMGRQPKMAMSSGTTSVTPKSTSMIIPSSAMPKIIMKRAYSAAGNKNAKGAKNALQTP